MFYTIYASLCTEKGMSPNAVAKEIGISSGAISEWKRGRWPRNDTLKKVADYFGVPMSFFSEDSTERNISQRVPLTAIPVYESVSAGFGTLARSEIVDYVPVAIPLNEALDYIGIRVQGDSMYPKIEDGDTVIVHKQTSVDNGTLAVVLVDGEEGYVKRVEYGPDWINLVSLNPMYPPMRFKGADVTRVSVEGRVVKVIKDV